MADPTRVKNFWPEGKKIEKFDVFRGNFPNSNPNHKWLTRPGSKIFDPDPSLKFTLLNYLSFKICLNIFYNTIDKHIRLAKIMNFTFEMTNLVSKLNAYIRFSRRPNCLYYDHTTVLLFSLNISPFLYKKVHKVDHEKFSASSILLPS